MAIQLTNCDWLSFSVLMTLTEEEKAGQPVLTEPPGFILVEQQGTNMYKRRAILYTSDGDKLLTLLWQPHSRIIKGNSLFVEVANPLLYNGRYTSALDLLEQIHPYTWQSLSRLDIATDFQPTLSQSKVIDMLQAGSVYVQGKRDGTMWMQYNNAAKYVTRTPHQLTWGNKQSQITWKLYNKSKEIFEHTPDGRTWCNKPYIAEAWRLAGMEANRDTWRVEVSIMSSGQLQWTGRRLSWDTVTDTDTLTRLFYDLYSTRMKMRLNEGHDNKRYDTVIDFLELPTTDPTSRIQKAAPASSPERVAYAPVIRSLVQQLERPEVQINEDVNQPLLASLIHICNTAGLRGYFARCVGMELDEWTEEYTTKGGHAGHPPQN